MEHRIAAMVDEVEAEAAGEWFDWCRSRLSGLDPLEGELAMPTDPGPEDEHDDEGFETDWQAETGALEGSDSAPKS